MPFNVKVYINPAQQESGAVIPDATPTSFGVMTPAQAAKLASIPAGGGSTFPAVSKEALVANALVAFLTGASPDFLVNANASSGGATRADAVGFATTAAGGAGVSVDVATAGERTIPDALWVSVPVVGDVGSPVFMSKVNGKVTIDVSTFVAGDVVQIAGKLSFAGGAANTTRVVVEIGDPVVLS